MLYLQQLMRPLINITCPRRPWQEIEEQHPS